MAIRDLAVAYNASSNADSALAFAVQMARKYDATLTGLHVHVPLALNERMVRWTPKDVLAQMREADANSVMQTEERFYAELARHGFDGTARWRVENGAVNDHLCHMARCHDVLLVGQVSEAGTHRSTGFRAEDLVRTIGRPMLVVPVDKPVAAFSEYAVVAWDGSRPASRALSDAMQILETKKRLDVVTVRPKGRKSGAEEDDCEVIRHLQAHGIPAERVFLESGRDGIAAAILDYCETAKPDVLVVGAYGHARLREDIFGGVTRTIIERMNCPVLMSH